MKIKDEGVLEPSFLDFTIPSDFAKKNLYYVPQYGHFYCNGHYSISRSYLDLFLCIYILDGALHAESRGLEVTAQKHQLLLLDCHEPHKYYCDSSADILWFHFAGNSSQAYTDYLFEMSGLLFEGNHILSLKPCFDVILSSSLGTASNEHKISSQISRILAVLAAPEGSPAAVQSLMNPAVSYIRQHYGEDIGLEKLASLCGLSISHFIRSFHKYIGCTPHEYLLSFRLRQAKQLLWSSTEPVEEISVQCGFNSASHFARAFRKQEGMTPTQFRNIRF